MRTSSKKIREKYKKYTVLNSHAVYAIVMTLSFIFVIFLLKSLILAAIVAIVSIPFTYLVSIDADRQLWFRSQSEIREGETICDFVRSIDYRNIDTHVIRAVYELLEPYYIYDKDKILPARADDSLWKDIKIDPDDIDMDLFYELLNVTGRVVDGMKKNPYYGKINTVKDLIMLINLQPKKNEF